MIRDWFAPTAMAVVAVVVAATAVHADRYRHAVSDRQAVMKIVDVFFMIATSYFSQGEHRDQPGRLESRIETKRGAGQDGEGDRQDRAQRRQLDPD